MSITQTNRRTPLYAWHTAHKARMVPFGGWDMPVQYSGIIDEHKAVRSGSGLFDVSHMARLSFHGPDAASLIESTFTNSLATMKDGQVRYGLLCNETGGILDDILVYKWPDHVGMVANASNREKVVGWLTKQAAGKKVDIKDHTEATVLIAVQGPRSVELVSGLFDADVSTLKYYFAAQVKYRGKESIVSRTGYTGEDGFELAVPAELGVALWSELMQRGTAPCGLGARDTLRLEAAMPLYGHELNETTNPIQAGLGWAVKIEKGEFIGREAIRAAIGSKTDRPRVGLELEGTRAAREGCEISNVEGKAVGVVTSGSYAPWVEKSIAMGYVEPASAAVGTKLFIDIRGVKIPAVVATMPFYKRKK